jgi:hypothetical protein
MKTYWVLSGPLPCGATALPEEAMGQPRQGTVWVDVCIMGQHLPQMYPYNELHDLAREDCAGLGLCEDCLGLGDLSPAGALGGLVRYVDDAARPCPGCAGSGRSALRVVVHRSATGISADIRPLPHAYVLPIDPELCTAFSAAPDICMACGFPPDGRGPRDEALHPADPG